MVLIYPTGGKPIRVPGVWIKRGSILSGSNNANNARWRKRPWIKRPKGCKHDK